MRERARFVLDGRAQCRCNDDLPMLLTHSTNGDVDVCDVPAHRHVLANILLPCNIAGNDSRRSITKHGRQKPREAGVWEQFGWFQYNNGSRKVADACRIRIRSISCNDQVATASEPPLQARSSFMHWIYYPIRAFLGETVSAVWTKMR